MNNILEIKNINVYLEGKQILKNISLPVRKNKITSIIGPSGCGKSTLLKTINRILEEEKSCKVEGQVFLKGENIKDIDRGLLRKSIGCVFQNPTPFPFSIYKNMVYALKYYGITDRKKLNNILEEKLKLVGLYDEVKENLNMSALKLSGGQQQRLCIGRTLTIEPEVILMDEPCSALDLKNTMKIEETLKNLCKNYTIIIVTHNLAQAKRISHYTSFMLNGELVEYGETDKVFNNPAKESTREYIGGLFG
ncbi:phosphate ABC transporter ATP-binding protein [Clostridium sp. A1-XYC3]|uniref:Phosphate ABC transporter ATP-binding protein n=1 Tax=Clostridium tanneri TaxID=3037988 RepID=A0ABU4JQY8_9CLOT|nr:phosphate ABC transporter ATP-binding protein [Clostridium sp. A1-XYC3]MDW8800560.1 phosphate ABC transporter ATP-binding protein [Clostridium sp. A1-XYC3]